MSVRSRPASWFELLVPRDELSRTLSLLASTHAVQLESHSRSFARGTLPELRADLDEFRELQQRYAVFWPAPRLETASAPREPQQIVDEALAGLRAWHTEAAPVVTALQAALTRREELEGTAALVTAATGRLPELGRLAGAGPQLGTCAFRLSPQDWPKELPTGALIQRIDAAPHCYLVAVGLREEIAALEEMLLARKARRVALPTVTESGSSEHAALSRMIGATDSQIQELRATLDRLGTAHRLDRVLGDCAFVDWYTSQVPQLAGTEHFAWVTGWTREPDAASLEERLRAAGIPHLLQLPPSPEGLEPPVTFRNPGWVRPFELFPKLLGTPGLAEADPSLMLAILAPLIFGFMFADVGQGLVLLVAGLLLRRRYPLLALLVPGGIASMIFGVLFGSAFALETVIPALWMRPLDAPLTVLGATFGLGAAVVLLGLALDALQHHWVGQAGRWSASRGGLVLAYVGVLLTFFDRLALWLLPLGATWFVVGFVSCSPAGTRLARIGPGIGEFLESALQIGVNTLSFLRVGAFALAHSGLSVAITGLAAAASPRAFAIVVLVLGNLFVIALEALVAGIQTTRLVLFEFFVRFLRGAGREFRPLPELDLVRRSTQERHT
jgi:V/A-type H+-transporting ATPase subunit I